MTTEQHRTLTLRETEQDELAANHADLFIAVQGSSLISGRAALTKAKEVAQLAASLAAAGVPEDNVFLENVRAEIGGGSLVRNSSASYSLRVRLDTLDRLGDALGALSEQKTAKLTRIVWRYPEASSLREELLRLCLRRIRSRAAVIAEELDSRLAGVHSVDEQLDERESERSLDYDTLALRRSRSPEASADLGMEIAHSKTLKVQVTVTYRLVPADARETGA